MCEIFNLQETEKMCKALRISQPEKLWDSFKRGWKSPKDKNNKKQLNVCHSVSLGRHEERFQVFLKNSRSINTWEVHRIRTYIVGTHCNAWITESPKSKEQEQLPDASECSEEATHHPGYQQLPEQKGASPLKPKLPNPYFFLVSNA